MANFYRRRAKNWLSNIGVIVAMWLMRFQYGQEQVSYVGHSHLYIDDRTQGLQPKCEMHRHILQTKIILTDQINKASYSLTIINVLLGINQRSLWDIPEDKRNPQKTFILWWSRIWRAFQPTSVNRGNFILLFFVSSCKWILFCSNFEGRLIAIAIKGMK